MCSKFICAFAGLVAVYVGIVLIIFRRLDYLTNVLGMPRKGADAALRSYE